MNDQLQTALANAIGMGIDSLNASQDVILGQLPEVVQQLLVWKATLSVVLCLVGIVALALVAWSFKFYRRGEPDERGLYKESIFFASRGEVDIGVILLAFTQLVLLVLGLALINLEWLKIWLAPKIFLIEYVAKLAK